MSKDKLKIFLDCPKCKLKKFASANIQFESLLNSKNFKYLGKYKNKKVKKNSSIICPECKYSLKILDIYSIITKTLEIKNEKINKRNVKRNKKKS